MNRRPYAWGQFVFLPPLAGWLPAGADIALQEPSRTRCQENETDLNIRMQLT